MRFFLVMLIAIAPLPHLLSADNIRGTKVNGNPLIKYRVLGDYANMINGTDLCPPKFRHTFNGDSNLPCIRQGGLQDAAQVRKEKN